MNYFKMNNFYRQRKEILNYDERFTKGENETWEEFVRRCLDFTVNVFFVDIKNVIEDGEWIMVENYLDELMNGDPPQD